MTAPDPIAKARECAAELRTMADQCERMEAQAAFGGAGTSIRVKDAPYLIDLLRRASQLAERVETLERALRPFAKVGQIIDSGFGPALFKPDDPFKGGAAWRDGEETGCLRYRDFSAARQALEEARDG